MEGEIVESWGKTHFGDFQFRRGDIVCYGLPQNYMEECAKYQSSFTMKDVADWGFTLLIAYLSNNSLSDVPYSQVVTHVGIIVKDGDFETCRVAEALNDGFIRHSMSSSCGDFTRFISVQRRKSDIVMSLTKEESNQAMAIFDQVISEYHVSKDEVDKLPTDPTLPYSWWHILNFAIKAYTTNQHDPVLRIRQDYAWSINQANSWLLYLTAREQSRGKYSLVCSESVTQILHDCQLHCRNYPKLWEYFSVEIEESRVVFPHEASAGISHCNVPFFHRSAKYDQAGVFDVLDKPSMFSKIPVIGKYLSDGQPKPELLWLKESRLGKEINALLSKDENEVGWLEDILASIRDTDIDLSNEKEVFMKVSNEVEHFLTKSYFQAMDVTETLKDKMKVVTGNIDEKLTEMKAKEKIQKIMDDSNDTRKRIAYNIKATASTKLSVLKSVAKNRLDLFAIFFHLKEDESFHGYEPLLDKMQADDEFFDQTMGEVSHLLAHAPTPRQEELHTRAERKARFGDLKHVRTVVDSKPVQWIKTKITSIFKDGNTKPTASPATPTSPVVDTATTQLDDLHQKLNSVHYDPVSQTMVEDPMDGSAGADSFAMKLVFWLFRSVVEPYFRLSSAAIMNGQKPTLNQVPVNYVLESNALVNEDPATYSKPPLTFFSYVMPNDLLFASTHECVLQPQQPLHLGE